MSSRLADWQLSRPRVKALAVAGILLLATAMGTQASARMLLLLLGGIGALALMRWPQVGLLALVTAALLVPVSIGTGTEVSLNAATLLVPILLAAWAVTALRRGAHRITTPRVSLPLLLFLVAGLLSLVIGVATWSPTVPRSGNFTLVQLAQWAIFAFSAAAFWLGGNLIRDEVWLRRLTWTFLLIAGTVALFRSAPLVGGWVQGNTTIAFIRAPLWILLTALAGGQLLFNRSLRNLERGFLVAVLLAVAYYSFIAQRDSMSNWAGVAIVAGVLLWLRFPRARGWVIGAIVILAAIGVLFPAVYNFAGGDAEWALSGQSRLVLIERVLQVTMRNPITGLGPAAYRPYTSMEPLPYGQAYWINPQINSHNNYVDIFSHTGIVGLALFIWFAVEVALLGGRLRHRYAAGFAAGYVNAALAAGVGSLAIMMLADWILPFVYNIGFPGFQASVLVWLFVGGLVALEAMENGVEKPENYASMGSSEAPSRVSSR